jgi:hypothetical protein
MTCEVVCQDLAACRQRGGGGASPQTVPRRSAWNSRADPTGGNNHQPQRPNARTRGGSFAEQWQIGWQLR